MTLANFARRVAAPVLAAASVLAAPQTFAASMTENFDGSPAGWIAVNRSYDPNEDWSLGNPGRPRSFPAHQGAPGSYVASSFNATFGDGSSVGDISNWLLTPAMVFNNGDQLSFFTRTVSDFANGIGPFPDRMQVRFSVGDGTDVGSDASSVGTFTQLLHDINPGLGGDYPLDWTMYTYTFSGLSGPTEGRIGFRHFVPQGGPGSFDSDYIGVDTVQVTAVPEPSAYAMAAMGLIVLGAWSRRRKAGLDAH